MNKWDFQLDTDEDRLALIKKLHWWEVKTPCLCTIRPRKKNRSDAQNNIFHVWCRERGKQSENGEIHEKNYFKLHYGVPILRHDEDFDEAWNNATRNMEPYQDENGRIVGVYEQQMALMKFMDITSLLELDEMTEFLNHVEQDCYEQGYHLTKPKQYDEAMG